MEPIGILVKKSWEIYKNNFRKFMGIILVPVGLSVALGFFAIVVPETTVWAFLLLGALIGLTVIGFWSNVALIIAVRDRSDEMGILEAYKLSKIYLLSYIWVTFALLAVIMGGFVFFVIPAYLLATWGFLAPYILVSENIKGISAIAKSRQYVKGYFWKILLRLLVFMALASLIFLIASMLMLLASIFGGELEAIIGPLVFGLANILLVPLAPIFGFLLYENLRTIKPDVLKEQNQKRSLFIASAIIGLLTAITLFALLIAISAPVENSPASDESQINSEIE